MALEYSSKIVTNGLITYYDPKAPNSSSGDTLYDLSGNGYNGTMGNGANISNGAVKTYDRYDYLRAGNYNFTSLRAYTVDLFFKRTDINNNGTGGAGQPTYYQGVFNYYWQQYIFVGTGSDANSTNLDIFGITTTLSLNQWVHIVGINGPDGRFAYINGTLLGTASGSTPSSAADVYFGNWDSSWASICEMSSIKMYNRGLSSSEVLQNYNAHKSRFGL
jgi:hypothetical protein